jgi:hypothetical protein
MFRSDLFASFRESFAAMFQLKIYLTWLQLLCLPPLKWLKSGCS